MRFCGKGMKRIEVLHVGSLLPLWCFCSAINAMWDLVSDRKVGF